MTDRIGQKELASAFALMRAAAVSAGVAEAARWQLDIGSKTYGRAYRVWLKHEDDSQTGHYTPAVSDYLGMTASEAFATVNHMRSAFQAVVWAEGKS